MLSLSIGRASPPLSLPRTGYAWSMNHEAEPRKPYPTDVSDEERAFVAPHLTLMDEAAAAAHEMQLEVIKLPVVKRG